MSAELPKSERARIMSELDEFFPEVKHTEREMHLLDENQQLESRIHALTAELEQADASLSRMLRDIGSLQERLATEGAAREKAEWMRDHWCQEYTKSQNELATAVEGLERYKHELASARELLAQALMVLVHWNNYQSEEGRSYIPEDENAAALLRIESWLTSHPAPSAVLPPISESDEAIVGALIDARTPPSKPMPAPVAAPCARCARLSAAIDQAIRDMLSGGHPFEKGVAKAINDLRAAQKDPERSDRWNDLGELPVTVMATSEYPSPAPCSGCASARELLQKIAARKECHAAIMAWLKEHP